MIYGKESRIWKKIKEVVAEFVGRLSVEVKKQEKLNIVEERNFRREKLLEKYSKDIVWME